MPNGEQALEQDQEGEDSAKESSDWQSPDDEDEEESDESDDEEMVESPPRSEQKYQSVEENAERKNTHPEATGMSILILGKVF